MAASNRLALLCPPCGGAGLWPARFSCPVPLAGAARPAAAKPPPSPGPRSGPAAVTRRPFPPATARNPPATWADTTALTDDPTYKYQVRAYDGTAYGPWSSAQSFTVETDTPGAVTVSCAGYPAGTWSAQAAGGTTCSFSAPLPYIFGYEWELGGVWQWSEGPLVTIDPGPGEYALNVYAVSDAGLQDPAVDYDFAVGAGGAMLSPTTGAQTSTTVMLQAGAPPGTPARSSTTGRGRPGRSSRSAPASSRTRRAAAR